MPSIINAKGREPAAMDKALEARIGLLRVPQYSERNLQRLVAIERRHRMWAWVSGCLRAAGGGGFILLLAFALTGEALPSWEALWFIGPIAAFWALVAWYRPSLCFGGFQFLGLLAACAAEVAVCFASNGTGSLFGQGEARPKRPDGQRRCFAFKGPGDCDRKVSRRIDLIHTIRAMRADLAVQQPDIPSG